MTSTSVLRSSHFRNALLIQHQRSRKCLSAATSAAVVSSSRAALLVFSQRASTTIDRSSLLNLTLSSRNSIRAMATKAPGGPEKLDKNTPEEKWKELLTAEQVREKEKGEEEEEGFEKG